VARALRERRGNNTGDAVKAILQTRFYFDGLSWTVPAGRCRRDEFVLRHDLVFRSPGATKGRLPVPADQILDDPSVADRARLIRKHRA
jgi:hypothetical protein